MPDPSFAATRTELQRIATHVLAHRRHDVTGRFGLRAAPGGFGTPAFGDDAEVLRVSGTLLVHERSGDTSVTPIEGRSLADLARSAGVDLGAPFEAGHDTPPVGDVDAPLLLDPGHVLTIASWFDLGWRALDAVLAGDPSAKAVQLWPEHFDAGTSVSVGAGQDDRCNLGASPGDGSHDEPYLYVGPWGPDRPGDTAYWNAPFGAVLAQGEVMAAPDPGAAAERFFRHGIERLRRV
jgi:hypothetical protein